MSNEELVELYQNGDNQVLDSLIEQNKGIITKLVNQYHTDNMPCISWEDLFQEGILGLVAAAQKFQPGKSQFITYAVYWIKQRISRYISKNINNGVSLQTPIDEENNTLEDVIQDNTDYENMAVDSVYLKDLKKDLKEAMEKVNTLKERTILELNFGLSDTEPMELKEIADLLNDNYDSIRATKSNALKKLRCSSIKAKYRDNLIKEMELRKYDSVDQLVNFIT